MEKDVVNFIMKYLHRQDYKAGKLAPRPLGGLFIGQSVEVVVRFDFVHVVAGGLLGAKSFDR